MGLGSTRQTWRGWTGGGDGRSRGSPSGQSVQRHSRHNTGPAESGEIVEILGQKEFKSASNSGIWYKIAPPSGEFRWVHGKYVDPDYLTSGVRTSRAGQSPLLGQVETDKSEDEPRLLRTLTDAEQPSAADVVPSPGGAEEPDMPAEEPSVAFREPSSSKEPTFATSEDEAPDPESVVKTADHWSPTVTGSPAEVVRATPVSATRRDRPDGAEVEASLTHRSKLIPELNTAEDGGAGDGVKKNFRAELNELEMELSIMLAEEPTVWNFDETRLGVQSLLANAETALERGKARGLASKIEQAMDIKQRYDAVGDVIARTDRHNRQLAQLSNSRAQSRAKLVGQTRAETRGRFDGVGRLARVVTPKVGSPTYALIGEKGDVTCYVTPAPGVNLHYYLGRQIGITGIRGILADRNVQHVTAKHVVEMSKIR